MSLLLEHKTNEYVRSKEPCVSRGTSPCHCQAMETNVVRPRDTALYPMQTIKQGIIDCVRRRGRQCKSWADNTI